MTNTTPRHALSPLPQWLTESWRSIAHRWPIWLVAYGLQAVLSILILAGGAIIVLGPILAVLPSLRSIPEIVWTWWLLPLSLLGLWVIFGLQVVSAWAMAAVTLALADGPTTPDALGSVFGRALALLWRAFWVSLWLGLILTGAALCFVVPFFILAPMLLPAWYIAVLENCPLREAIEKSRQCTAGCRGEILGRVFVLVGMFLAVFLLTLVLSSFPLIGIITFPIQLGLQLILPAAFLAAGYHIYRELRCPQL